MKKVIIEKGKDKRAIAVDGTGTTLREKEDFDVVSNGK
jgi:hypothetical protein